MKLTSIKRSFSVPHALARYNRRHRTELQRLDLAILYVIKESIGFPVNRYKIVRKLCKLHQTTDYVRLNKRLHYLTAQGLTETNRGGKKYTLTIGGEHLLTTIETYLRNFRPDRLKS